MQQLQAWADEGRYDWENGTFNFKGTKRFHPYLSMDEDQQEKYHTLDWKALVQLVLDGTIKVWRPVDKYEMPMYEYIMVRLDPKAKHSIGKGTCPYFIGRFNDSHSDENEFFLERPREGDYLSEYLGEATLHGGTVTDGGEFSIERHEITHWQPLPQPPQEVSHA
jgi:hypothetical protein